MKNTITPEMPEEKVEDQKSTNTAFILMFPSMILACIAAYYTPLIGSIVAVALALYQFLMLSKFIKDYYRK